MSESLATRCSWTSRSLLVLGGYVLLTIGFTYPMAAEFAHAIPGDGFDGWQNYWNLWWVKTALLEHHTHPWFTDLLYHPTGVSLLFHTLNAFNGFTFLPVQLATGLVPAYNSVVLFSFAVGGLGCYLLARHVLGLRSSRLAAFVAGVIFTFSPYHAAHLLGHMQLISLQWIPFYVLYLLRTTQALGESQRQSSVSSDRPSAWKSVLRNGSLAALFLVLVTLCDWYYLMYCLFITALVLAWTAWRTVLAHWRGPQGSARFARVLVALGGIWLAWAIVLSPMLVPMVREASRFDFMVPDPLQSRTFSADLLAFVTPQEFHPIWGSWARQQAERFSATVSEHQVFAGYAVLLLAAVGAWQARRSPGTVGSGIQPRKGPTPVQGGPSAGSSGHPDLQASQPGDATPATVPAPGTTGLWLLIVLTFFTLALGPVLHVGGRTDLLPGGGEIALPYGAVARALPFMDITRSVSRFTAVVMLALGVLSASAVNRLVRRGWQGRAAGVAVTVLILFEFLPAPYPMSRPDTPDWYYSLAADPRPGAVLNLPTNWDRPGYLLYQTEHAKPLATAYISREDPRTLADRVPVLQHLRHLEPDIVAFDIAVQGRQVLSDLGIGWVVLDRYKMPGGAERAVTEDVAKALFGSQAPVFQDERLTAYEVTEPEYRAPYIGLGMGWEPFNKDTKTRAFTDAASLLVRGPTGSEITLVVTLAPGSAPLAGLQRTGGIHSAALTLATDETVIILRSQDPGARVEVKQLALDAR